MADSPSNIYEKLRKIQVELKAPKNETGRFGKSRSAEAILQAAKPVCDKHGLTLVVSDEIVNVGNRNYVKATAAVHDSTGVIEATGHAWEGEINRGLDASQVTGMASSYARKYAMGGLFAIDDTKDADSDEHAPQKPVEAVMQVFPEAEAFPLATEGQKSAIKGMLIKEKIPTADWADFLLRNYGVNKDTMTKADAARVMKEMM